MKDLPFSVYDFLVSFGSGAALLRLVDFAFGLGWFAGQEPGAYSVVGWAIACYTTGHIVAQLSGWLIEDVVLRRVIKRDESTIFRGGTGWRRSVFPRVFATLPPETQTRILERVPEPLRVPGPALFNHCFAMVKRDPIAFQRMNTFQMLYGFARNISFVTAVAAMIFAIRAVAEVLRNGEVLSVSGLPLIIAAFVSVMMFYRYLNFHWRYSHELYVTYAAAPDSSVESVATLSDS